MTVHRDNLGRLQAKVMGFDTSTGEFLAEVEPEKPLVRYFATLSAGGGGLVLTPSVDQGKDVDQVDVGKRKPGPTRADLAGIDQLP